MGLGTVRVEVPDEGYWRRQIRCQDACPVHTDARGYVRAIANGDFEGAYLIARGPNPLASICGRICGAPCEASCRRGRIDQSIAIRALKRFVADRYDAMANRFNPLELLSELLSDRHRECSGQEEIGGLRHLLRNLDAPPASEHRVAIIGAGPAGLAAAHDLALLGIAATVFEAESVPGGMLAIGIPAYRLPRDLIQAEIDVIRALGVQFECNAAIRTPDAFQTLRRDFDATIIAVGAQRSKCLGIPGADGPGVFGGVEFLRDVALGLPIHMGHRVITIGGGNVAYDVSRSVVRQTGLDVSRSALRQTEVREVRMVSLESLEEMPADDVEIIEGDEEGVQRHHRLGPQEILRDENGAVRGVRFKKVSRVFDEAGRFAPVFDDAKEIIIEGDTVIWAIGQQPDLAFLSDDGDVHRTQRGMIASDPSELTTSAPDVFVAGDIAHGARLLIDAVASGKQAARSVHHFLTGKRIETRQVMLHLPILNYQREADYEKQPRVSIPVLSPEERVSSQTAVVETGYPPELACRDADRCLDCGVNTIFDSRLCILCGGCADVCPELCLRLISVSRLQEEGAVLPDLATRLGAEESDAASAIIKDEQRCIRCGLCAERCPVGAITMERMTYAQTWEEVKT